MVSYVHADLFIGVHHYKNSMYTERKSATMDYSCCNSGLVSLSPCRALVVCGLKHKSSSLWT